MNLGRLDAELRLLVMDRSLFPRFTQWFNDAVEEIAADFDLPALRVRQPSLVTTNNAAWIYDMPSSYSRNLFKCYNLNDHPVYVCRDMEELDRLDIRHTTAGEKVTHIVVDPSDNSLCVYPMANDVLSLWFYQKPTPMVNAADEPTCIPAEFRSRVILPKTIIKNYRILQDMITDAPDTSLAYWEAEYGKGLFGGPKSGPGMINYLAKGRGAPRRHGGRDPLP